MRSLDYALEKGARVVNMSWGSEAKSAFLASSVAYEQQKGMVLVSSAGNEPTGQPLYPASYQGVISVSATIANGEMWSSSNYGDDVFLAAPGTASFPVGHDGPPGSYAGTSISSAYVSRALAQYFALHPNATRSDAINALRSSLTDAGASGKDPYYGYGALDAAAKSRLLAN